MPRMGTKKNRKDKMIVFQGQRVQMISLAPHTVDVLGKWKTGNVVDRVIAFSKANGGPEEFLEAMEYWSDGSRFVGWSVTVEVAIWWSMGYALHLRSEIISE